MMDEERKQIIQKGFDTVAPGYDHPSLSFFPETAQRMVEHLALDQLNQSPGLQWLDVCTGTGCVAIAAAEKLGNGKVTGIDLSSGMLQQARNKAAAKNLGNTSFQQMDLEQLTFPKDTFDIATSSFGLFFMEDMPQALGNIASTVKDKGKIAISSFCGDAFQPMADVFIKHYEATGRTMPSLSWKRLATEELITGVFNAVNITKVDIHHEPLGYHMTDPSMWWDVVWNAGWRSLLNLMSPEEQEQFKEQHMKEVTDLVGKDGVWFNTEVMIAVGEKQ